MKYVPNWLKYIKFWGNPLEEEILKNYKNVKRGEYIFGDVGATHSSIANSGVGFKLYAYGMVLYKEAGFKGYFGRATNRGTTRLIEKFGGKVLKTVKLDDPKKP